jgi:hypothetical protein
VQGVSISEYSEPLLARLCPFPQLGCISKDSRKCDPVEEMVRAMLMTLSRRVLLASRFLLSSVASFSPSLEAYFIFCVVY